MIDDPLGGFSLGEAFDDEESQADASLVVITTADLFEMSFGDYPLGDLIGDSSAGFDWGRLLHPPVNGGRRGLSQALHPRAGAAEPFEEEQE